MTKIRAEYAPYPDPKTLSHRSTLTTLRIKKFLRYTHHTQKTSPIVGIYFTVSTIFDKFQMIVS